MASEDDQVEKWLRRSVFALLVLIPVWLLLRWQLPKHFPDALGNDVSQATVLLAAATLLSGALLFGGGAFVLLANAHNLRHAREVRDAEQRSLAAGIAGILVALAYQFRTLAKVEAVLTAHPDLDPANEFDGFRYFSAKLMESLQLLPSLEILARLPPDVAFQIADLCTDIRTYAAGAEMQSASTFGAGTGREFAAVDLDCVRAAGQLRRLAGGAPLGPWPARLKSDDPEVDAEIAEIRAEWQGGQLLQSGRG